VLAAAAAAAMVAGGASGIELSGLVQDERAAVSLGALDQLAENMDAQQADEIVRMLLEGCSGKTDELLALLGAIPADVEDSTVENLWSLLARSRDADRDPVLEALAIAHQDERLIASLKSMSDADRQKLAQLNHVYFSDVALALALLDDPNPRTAQVALSAIGHRGSGAEVDAAVGKIGSRPQNPQYLRAQILWTLADSVLRGNSHAVPEHLLSDSACRSAHILTRAGTLRLAVAMMKDCAGLPGEQSLRLDPDPRVRLVVAWAAWSRAERSSGIQDVLRHCRIYEPSALVARACTEALALEARQESRRSSSLLIRPIWTDGPAAGYPALLLVNARLLSVVADRSGRVSLPAGDVRSLDPGFYF
jgi:hypothetical protein